VRRAASQLAAVETVNASTRYRLARAVLGQLVERDLEPAYPIAVTFPARSEAIDALFGTEGGSPPVVPDETELAIANCASRGYARSKTSGAVGHLLSTLGLSQLFVDHPFSPFSRHTKMM
jgi:hypothetical protein